VSNKLASKLNLHASYFLNCLAPLSPPSRPPPEAACRSQFLSTWTKFKDSLNFSIGTDFFKILLGFFTVSIEALSITMLSIILYKWCGREGDLGFMVEILWNWGRTRKERKDLIADRNPDLGFTAYDSIHEIKINNKSKYLYKFNSNHHSIYPNLI